jgi:hypothetical protein
VRAYAQSIGHELGLGRRELDLLNWAALLHDIGKLDVPHEILAKTGRPTPEEWELLRGHPAAGAKLAEPLRAWLGEWSAAIVEHHERWDGQGYPRGLAGDEISLAGRIVAVADVFDVITSTRSYKPSSSVAEARQELARCAGTQFDPEVVRALLSISVRQGRLAAPLAWAAHAAALVRLPATQAANGLSAGAAAVAVGVGVGIGAGIPTHPPAAAPPTSPAMRPAARPQVAHPASVSHRPAKPGARARVVRSTPAAHVRRPVVATSRVAPVDPVENAAPAARPSPSSTVQRPEPPAAAPEHAPAPRTASPPAASATVPAPRQASASEPVAPAHAPVSAVPPPAVPPTGQVAAPLGDDLTGKVSEVTGDVASLTGDVASVADPSTPLDDDVSSVLDDVGSLTSHVTSLLSPPPPAASPSPPQAPSPPPDAPPPPQQRSVVDQAVSLLGGLGK